MVEVALPRRHGGVLIQLGNGSSWVSDQGRVWRYIPCNNSTYSNDRTFTDRQWLIRISLPDDSSRANEGTILHNDPSVTLNVGTKRHVVTNLAVMRNMGIDVGMKETANSSIRRDG